MNRRIFSLLGTLFVFSLWIFSVSAQEPTLYVNAGKVVGEISPYVYGANYGPLQVVPIDLFPQAEVSGIRFLRFPGGRWGDLNDIQHFQIDMYMGVARLMNADVSINVRLENGTPEAAAELVHYTNIEKDYNVRYWGIGNEPSLFDNYTTDDLNEQWRAIAEAMLAVDPTIILFGPEPHQWTGSPSVDPRDAEGREWVREFLKVNGDLVDIVAVHRYPFPTSMANPVISIEDLRQNAKEWEMILPNLRQVIEETTGRTDLLVAVTEANSHWSSNSGTEASPDSHYNAIWWADVLGRLIKNQAFIVNYFDLQSKESRGGSGLLATYTVRPTYYVYQLYQRFGNQLLEFSAPDDDVTIYASLREDGALTLIVVNMMDTSQTRSLQVDQFEAQETGEYWLFDTTHNAELIDSAWQVSDSLSLPPQSISLFVIPPR